jgi:hypothetical protein
MRLIAGDDDLGEGAGGEANVEEGGDTGIACPLPKTSARLLARLALE